MLEFCVKQNVFLYAMIAAGIAGVWCLFWNNRFYTRAIRDLGRLKEPKSKWCWKRVREKRIPFRMPGRLCAARLHRAGQREWQSRRFCAEARI